MVAGKLTSFEIFITCTLFLSALRVACSTAAAEGDSKEEEDGQINRIGSINHNHLHSQSSWGSKGDTTVPTSSRLTSSRAYVDDRKRDNYRYYGTGSKSGNSFLPTNIHKTTSSLDSHNYFVTTKSNLKDLDAAGSGMSGTGAEGNNYLTVYESPAMMNSGGGNGGAASMFAMDDQFGDMAAETGHGGGYGHGGGGHGGGKGCNSALGLLGVLGLAAYLQNVLRNMQNGTAGRRRRDVSLDDPFDTEAKLEKVRSGMAHLDIDVAVSPLNETSKDLKLDEKTYKKVIRDVFPLLSAVAHARDGLIPIHCTHSSVCLANRILVQDLGSLGHSIGIRISSAIAKLLTKITRDERAEQIRMISKAGKMGRNGRNCLKVFPTCHRLRKLPTYNIPSILDSHHDRTEHTNRNL